METEASQVDRLVGEVLAGDIEAYGEIVTLFQGDLWLAVMPILLSREATKDVLQQAFLKAFDSLQDYKPGTSFRGWLRTIARNLARNELRRRANERSHLTEYSRYRLQVAPESASTGEQGDLRHQALQECRKALPPQLQNLLQLYYAQNQPVDLIARTLNRTAEAVRQMLWRSRLFLRDCIMRKLGCS
jgi:RNA polymerase sigma-70 factor (ECF subfamily)